MKAQQLYNLRQDYEFCDGKELSEFFRQEVGQPSPSGSTDVNTAKAVDFMNSCLDRMAANSPSLASYCKSAKTIIQSVASGRPC